MILLLASVALAAPPLTVELTCPGLARSSHALLAFDQQGQEIAAAAVPAGATHATLHPTARVHRLVLVGAACSLEGVLPPGEHARAWLSEAGAGAGPDPARCQDQVAAMLQGGPLPPALERCGPHPELLQAWPRLAPEVRHDKALVALLDGPELRAHLVADRADPDARRRLLELWEGEHDHRDPPWLTVGSDRILVTGTCTDRLAEHEAELVVVGDVLVLRPDAHSAQALPLPQHPAEPAAIVCGSVGAAREPSPLLWRHRARSKQEAAAAKAYAQERR